MDHRCDTTFKGKKADYWFLVKWEDFEEPAWEPYANLKFNVFLTNYVKAKQMKMFYAKDDKEIEAK